MSTTVKLKDYDGVQRSYAVNKGIKLVNADGTGYEAFTQGGGGIQPWNTSLANSKLKYVIPIRIMPVPYSSYGWDLGTITAKLKIETDPDTGDYTAFEHAKILLCNPASSFFSDNTHAYGLSTLAISFDMSLVQGGILGGYVAGKQAVKSSNTSVFYFAYGLQKTTITASAGTKTASLRVMETASSSNSIGIPTYLYGYIMIGDEYYYGEPQYIHENNYITQSPNRLTVL